MFYITPLYSTTPINLHTHPQVTKPS